MIQSHLLLVFPAAMAFAGAMDLLTMTIPNRISALVAAFIAAALFAGLSAHAVMLHAASGFLVLALGIGLFAMGWAGGGDAKLLAAGALWVGLDQVVPFLVQTGICGAVLTLVMVLFRAYPAASLPIPDWAVKLHSTATGMPYGLAIAAGALFVFPQTESSMAWRASNDTLQTLYYLTFGVSRARRATCLRRLPRVLGESGCN